jgi:UPF0755 protein
MSLRAGEYSFSPGASVNEVLEKITSGKTVVHRLTIPEGTTSREVLLEIEALTTLSGPLPPVPLEGMILPETYHFSRGDSREELLKRMSDAMTDAAAELWEDRADGLPFNSIEEAIILASIVEKETAVAEERGLVAGVFINRLRRGMRLQSDPTVVFGITLGKAPLGRALRRSDLKQSTPYNTYLVDGLPPGPIANPGRESLEAVLNPAATKFLYFVADGSGGHAFAETLGEHNRNVAHWRKIEPARRATAN